MFSNSWNECPAFHWIDQPTNNAPCSGYGITTSVTVTVMLPVPCFCVLPVKPCDGFWIWNGAPLYKLYLFRSICRDRGSFWALGVFGRFSMFWVVLVPSGYGYGLPSRRCRNWRWSGLDVGICPFFDFLALDWVALSSSSGYFVILFLRPFICVILPPSFYLFPIRFLRFLLLFYTGTAYGAPYGSAHPYGPHTYHHPQASTSTALSRHQHHPQFFSPTGPPQLTHFANGSIHHPNPPLQPFEVEPPTFPTKKAPMERSV